LGKGWDVEKSEAIKRGEKQEMKKREEWGRPN
jgi:hypothetical protein